MTQRCTAFLLLSALAALAAPASAVTVLSRVDSDTGVTGIQALVVSADGLHVYTANGGGNSVSVFSRNTTPGPTFGSLTLVQTFGQANFGSGFCAAGNWLRTASSIVITADGANVYATSAANKVDTIVGFTRNPVTGVLTCRQVVQNHPNLRKATGLSISSDGLSVYAVGQKQGNSAQNSVTVYDRNTGTGVLTFREAKVDTGATFWATPTSTWVSPDVLHVYATGENAVTVFQRSALGALTAPASRRDNVSGADGLGGAAAVAVSSDGTSVYVASPTDGPGGAGGSGAIAVLVRNPATGALSAPTGTAVFRNGIGGIGTSLSGVTSVAVAPGGGYVYAVAPGASALNVFSRDPATGNLAFVEATVDATFLGGARAVAVSPNGLCVYVAATSTNRVSSYCQNAADFGDAPEDGVDFFYATTAPKGGAQHPAGTNVWMGSLIDTEANGQPTADADGDDLTDDLDEDGAVFANVTPPGPTLVAGAPAKLTVDLSGSAADGLVDAWIDFNGDGDFDDAGERVTAAGGASVTGAGPHDIAFNVPTPTVNEQTVARVRIRATGSQALAAGGGGGEGEVEDQVVPISDSTWQLRATKSGNGAGTVTADQGGLDCGTSCTVPVADVQPTPLTATFTATPDVGSDFVQWSGDCTGAGACAVTMDQDRTVDAEFALEKRTLTVTIALPGGGSGATITSSPGAISCLDNTGTCSDNQIDYGTQVQLTHAEGVNLTFTGWSSTPFDPSCSGGDPCVVSLTQDTTVSATYSNTQFALNVIEDGTGTGNVKSNPPHNGDIDCGGTSGGIDCTETYPSGTSVTLLESPDADSVFGGWSGGGCSGLATTCAVTVNQTQNVTATFTQHAGVSVAITDGAPGIFDDGQAVSIDVAFTNGGPQAAGNLPITITLPSPALGGVQWQCISGGCTLPLTGTTNLSKTVSIAANTTLLYRITGTAPTPALDGTTTSATIDATAITPAGYDADDSNNSATHLTPYVKLFLSGFELGISQWPTSAP